jgi:hypothetical protein
MSSRDTTPKKKKSRHKAPLEPISMDEILAGPGMSGFVSILDPPEEVPHLQALVDDIKDIPLLSVTEGRWKGGWRGDAEADPAGSRLAKPAGANVIHLHRRASGAEADKPPPTPEAKKGPGAEREPGAERDTGSSLPRPPDAGAATGRHHVRRAALAQDGHSSGEEVLYQSLWNYRYARQESKDTRLVTIGWKAMSKLARLTPRNTRRNCQSLIDKLAVEQLSGENSRESIGRTYRLFSYKAILERRRTAGLEWVTRSRGVTFVAAPATAGTKVDAVRPPLPETPERDTGAEMAPDAERDPGAKRDTRPAGFPDLIVRTLREYLPDVDDASVVALIEACRQKTPDASEEEINHFVRIKADLMHRMGTVKSPMGFLKASVPRCFEGESFRQFREAEARRREAAALREAAQEEELRRFQEEQRAILNDPKASEEDRKFARRYLGIPAVPGEKGTGG